MEYEYTVCRVGSAVPRPKEIMLEGGRIKFFIFLYLNINIQYELIITNENLGPKEDAGLNQVDHCRGYVTVRLLTVRRRPCTVLYDP